MRPNHTTRPRFTIPTALLLLALLPAPALAEDVFRFGTRQATIGWDPPDDPDATIDGYFVSLSFNGEPETLAGFVPEARYTIEAEYGDSVVARVQTLGRSAGTSLYQASAHSPESPRIRFFAPPQYPSQGLLTLHCAACGTLETRPISQPGFETTVPARGAPWEVLGVADVTPRGEGPEIVWYDPTTGDLEVVGLGDPEGEVLLTPYVSLFGREPLGLVDANGDGTSEIVLRHPMGSVELWTAFFGWVVRGASMPVPVDYEFVSGRDLDGDGTGDLWWWTSAGELHVWRMRDRAPVAIPVRLTPPGDSVPTAVGDFDGDGTPDALWRDESGSLTIHHLGPGASPVQRRIVRISGDKQRQVHGVADFDGVPGEEILLQHRHTLAIDLVHPLSDTAQRDRLIDMDEAWHLVDVRND